MSSFHPEHMPLFEQRVRDRDLWRADQKPSELIDYSSLAADYETASIGYAAELYATLFELGLKRSGKIVDVACGTGLASTPLAAEGARITGVDVSETMMQNARARNPGGEFVKGSAEALPFEDASFDGAVCAQAFHWLDRDAAMNELVRCVKPGGAIAIWWKHLMADDPVKGVRDEVSRSFNIDVPDAGLRGGFLEFYRAPLCEHNLRVIPWRMALPLDRFMAYERSRYNLRAALGGRIQEYLTAMTAKLHEKYGSDNPFLPLSYMHFLYIGRKS